jgi:hypothetical protein
VKNKRGKKEREGVFSYGAVSKQRWHIGTPKSPIDSMDRKTTQRLVDRLRSQREEKRKQQTFGIQVRLITLLGSS